MMDSLWLEAGAGKGGIPPLVQLIPNDPVSANFAESVGTGRLIPPIFTVPRPADKSEQAGIRPWRSHSVHQLKEQIYRQGALL